MGVGVGAGGLRVPSNLPLTRNFIYIGVFG